MCDIHKKLAKRVYETQYMHKKQEFCVHDDFKYIPLGLKAVIFAYLLGKFGRHWLTDRIRPN
ncbi:MAG: hypothetical protein BGO14_08715 [Chlamydiales bacterium 38-26]|nr:hypothetical protein [Chlamydiales bacterium]OJV11067.1 MAG: hypothetical protein BGO14_08715 [Chlamydiales bacterium 38-26]